MRIVFLDFDGVLNSHAYFKNLVGPGGCMSVMIDPAAVARLNHIVERTGAYVVLSTSWRHGNRLGSLAGMLEERGFVGKVIGKTPMISFTTRGAEIAEWLRLYGEDVESYVVLDDDDDIHPLEARHVRTSVDVGLSDGDVKKAVSLLRESL